MAARRCDETMNSPRDTQSDLDSDQRNAGRGDGRSTHDWPLYSELSDSPWYLVAVMREPWNAQV